MSKRPRGTVVLQVPASPPRIRSTTAGTTTRTFHHNRPASGLRSASPTVAPPAARCLCIKVYSRNVRLRKWFPLSLVEGDVSAGRDHL